MTTSESRPDRLTLAQVVAVLLEQFDMRLSNAGDDVHLLLFSRFEAEAVRAALSDYRRSETAKPDSVTLPLETAKLVRKACLPLNPNKCRGWHPDLLAAARAYIAAVEAADLASREREGT